MLNGVFKANNNTYIGSSLLPIAEGAAFGSYENQHEPECLPGTRTGLLDHI